MSAGQRVKIQFSTLGTDGKPNEGVVSLRQMAINQEAMRRESAEKQAYNAGCGLVIHIYEYRTEYWLDFSLAIGITNEQMMLSGK